MTSQSDDMSPEAIMARAIAARGDVYPEWRLVAEALPELFELVQRTSGYFHKYSDAGTSPDELSGPMRELIATPALCAKPDMRYAPNHVRKMYRMGLTNRVIFEAAAVYSAVTGFSTLAHTAEAVMTALSPDYPFGALPEGGAPRELTPFPELELGRAGHGAGGETLLNQPEWQFALGLDEEFARRAAGWVDHCLLADGERDDRPLLGPGPRELVAIAALCTRGEVELAAEHMARAYACGMSRGQVLDAIMSVLPMTGIVTAHLGLRAMRLVESR